MNLINEDDVQKVLDKFLGKRPKKISGFSVTPHGDVTTGYLGTYLTLVINFCEDEGEEKAKFFIKAHKSVDTENDFLGKSGIFQKEIDFYRVLVEDMRKTVGDLAWCPRYCFSKSRVLGTSFFIP